MEVSKNEIEKQVNLITGDITEDSLYNLIFTNIKDKESICFICTRQSSNKLYDLLGKIRFDFKVSFKFDDEIANKNVDGKILYFVITRNDEYNSMDTKLTDDRNYLIKSRYIGKYK